jgi:hypothetical protein
VGLRSQQRIFKTFSDISERSHEDAEPTVQLELIDVFSSNELRSKFEEGESQRKIPEMWKKGTSSCRLLWKLSYKQINLQHDLMSVLGLSRL